MSRGAQVSRVRAHVIGDVRCCGCVDTWIQRFMRLQGRGQVEQGIAQHDHQPVTEFYKDYHQLKQHLRNGPVSARVHIRSG